MYQKYYPFNDYCTPRKNWRLIYSYSPTQGLSPAQAKLVLGAEIHAWSEQIDGVSLDVTLWPRASAAAEVLWSGRTDAAGVNRTFADASPRLGEMRERMVARGVGAAPVMQLWYARTPRPRPQANASHITGATRIGATAKQMSRSRAARRRVATFLVLVNHVFGPSSRPARASIGYTCM